MRVSKRVFFMFIAAALAAGAAVVAQGQQPPAGGEGRGRGQGRGGAPRVEIKDGEECPAGMVEVRQNSCHAPVSPPPSIVDYRPRSTVVAKPTLVPRAKLPVVDVHTPRTSGAASFAQRIPEMDALNLRVLVDLSGAS